MFYIDSKQSQQFLFLFALSTLYKSKVEHAQE